MDDLRPVVPVPAFSFGAFVGGGLRGELTEAENNCKENPIFSNPNQAHMLRSQLALEMKQTSFSPSDISVSPKGSAWPP
jgi:hypothetical protein